MPATSVPSRPESAKGPFYAIAILSVLVAAFLIWLIYFKGRAEAPEWVASLPAANATFNSLSAICLVGGYLNIRRKRVAIHRRFMLSAAGFSALFLVSYITYHYFHGDTKFPGHGWIRPVYFFILISHIGLSMVALPLIFATLYFALTSGFQTHRKVARWTFPIWLYISVTGVAVFFLLRAYTA
jgi:putative membrane protein